MADQTTTPAASPCGAPASAPSGAPSGGGGGGETGAQGGSPNWMGSVSMVAIFILIFYFFIIRPQRKKQKQQETLLSSITRGDQIITIGGFFGTVRDVRDDSFMIEIADGVKARILKSAVQTKRAPASTSEEKKD